MGKEVALVSEKFSSKSSDGILSAKELYSCLGIKKDFNGWIEQKVGLFKLVDGQDYVRVDAYKNPVFVDGKNIGGRPVVDYALTMNTVMRIVMSNSRTSFDVRARIVEQFCNMKNRATVNREIYEAKVDFAGMVVEKDKVIRNMGAMLAQNNGIAVVDVSGNYKETMEYLIIKRNVEKYAEKKGIGRGEGWMDLYNKFDSIYSMDIRAVANGSKLPVIEVIYRIGMLDKLSMIRLDHGCGWELASGNQKFGRLMQNEEF